MRDNQTRLSRRSALIALTAALALPSIGYAAPSFDDDKKEKAKPEDAKTDKDRSERDDRQTTGQVMEINTLADPPELWIANGDGLVHVRLLTTDLIAKNGVRLGDHITVIGEKVSEVEFECQELNVDARYGVNDEDDDDDDEDD
jgi:hypothetical protein